MKGVYDKGTFSKLRPLAMFVFCDACKLIKSCEVRGPNSYVGLVVLFPNASEGSFLVISITRVFSRLLACHD